MAEPGPKDGHDPAAAVVLDQLADGSVLTASQISEASGLARSTVLHAVSRLEAAGGLRQHPPETSARGRPSRRWSTTNPPGAMAVAVPAAHGSLVGVVRPDGEVLALVQEPSPAVSAPEPARHLLDLLDRALLEAGLTGDDIGLAVLGLPGASEFSATPEARPAPQAHLRRFRDWDGQLPTAVLSRRLGCPVFSENDANLAALGEAGSGAGAGHATVMYVALAHGTGCGLVLGARLHRGASLLAGEIGHLHMSDDGPLCECGARGCFWQTHSLPALLTEMSALHGRPFQIQDVAAAVRRDELDVTRALRGLGEALGRRLADAVVFLDPDIIVVDPALHESAEVVAEGIRVAVQRCAPPDMVRSLRISPGALGATAHLHGAVRLAQAEKLWRFARR
jgi:predicted NBD/HSP70 family sugar kinase